jgi:hypothetical protein
LRIVSTICCVHTILREKARQLKVCWPCAYGLAAHLAGLGFEFLFSKDVQVGVEFVTNKSLQRRTPDQLAHFDHPTGHRFAVELGGHEVELYARGPGLGRTAIAAHRQMLAPQS